MRIKYFQLEVEDKVFLKLLQWEGFVHLGKCRELSPKYIEPYEITKKAGIRVYELTLTEEFL